MERPQVFGVCIFLGIVVLLIALHRAQLEYRNNKVRRRLGTDIRMSVPVRLGYRQKAFAVMTSIASVAYLIGGPGLSVVGLSVVVLFATYWRSRKRRAFVREYENHLPLVLDALMMSVKSGASLPVAVNEVAQEVDGPVAVDLGEIARRLDLGFGLVASLKALNERRRFDSVRVMVASLSLAYESGLPVADSLGSVRETVGFALMRADVARTAAAQARASTMVLAALPVMVSGPMLLFNEAARHFMFHTVPGVTILVVGLTLDICGVLWMNRLIERTQS